jgi:molybdopterin molybdotransferase
LARLKGFQELVPVDEALKRFLIEIEFQPKKSVVPLESGLNRVVSEDIVAQLDLPRTDRSAVDGYAVKASETVGASQTKPRILRMGDGGSVIKKQAKRIWTGNPLPDGADAVVMLENVKLMRNKVEVWSPATRGENVSKQGEDLHRGSVAVRAGRRLRPQHLGLLAALGMRELRVFEKPKIAVLATGNELAESGMKLQKNQIFDSNKFALMALCVELGAETVDLGIAKDELKQISEKLQVGLEESDAIVTSGGTSVGAPDLVPDAINSLGRPGIIVHGVAMRPGMPTALAVVSGKPLLVLPGNPAAAMLSFEVFGRPLVSKLLGLEREESRPVLKARLTKRITVTLGRKNLVRVRVLQQNGEFLAKPVSVRGSGLISTITESNGYVVTPENVEGVEEGEIVPVHLFDSLEVT